MQNVIIAAAPITKEEFHPVYQEFPISDKTLLACMGSSVATDAVLNAACLFFGIDPAACVSGMYYRLPERQNRPFEYFLMDLRKRHKNARDDIQRRREAVLSQHREKLFAAVLTL